MYYRENMKFYFLNSDLGENRTGIENASLLRARMFKFSLHISPIIATAAYNPWLNLQRKKLYESGLLCQDSEIINLYEYFQETITYDTNSDSETFKTNDKWIYKPVNNTKDYRIYDENNNLLIYRKCDVNGLLLYNNIFVNKKKVRRDYYDSNGFLSKSQFLDLQNSQVYSEAYYRTDGSVCIYKHFEFKDNKSNLQIIQLLNKKGGIIETLKSETELISYWIKNLIKEKAHHFIIIDKERVFYPAVSGIKEANVSVVCTIHSSHLKNGQDIMKGSLNSNYRQIFEDMTKPDAIVVLTHRQKKHIEDRFGIRDNLYVIPHPIQKKDKVDLTGRVPLSAVYLARYSEEKQHDSLIRVFHKVVQKHRDARLDLFGFGKLKASIINQINELGLQNNVFVNDFTNNIDAIYDSASMAILPSRVEGFSLFLLESIAHGCPIVCYDIDYGPGDLVDNGINGHLVELNNEEEMAQRIIDIFDDRKKLSEMSEASYRKAEFFQFDAVAKQWQELIKKVLERSLFDWGLSV